ncbi:MAG TPA: DUF4926 domain-containing protein [Anaerolineae bacterium]|nr:DUF4926 domain-containing protein [Anaerolineae bacterium]HIP73420.1 DUF4926 domain-containing protein [Anaerolineae bacterium]
MRHQLFQEVVLAIDIPEKGLKKGDVATVVEHHPVQNGENGYSLEIFNALGETIAVVTVRESAITSLSADEILSVRPLVAMP